MNSDVKLWAQFSDESNGKTFVSLTPVLFWVSDEEGFYEAHVLASSSEKHPIGYALPCHHNNIRERFGEIQGFILHDNLAVEIAELKKWVYIDEDNRSFHVYP